MEQLLAVEVLTNTCCCCLQQLPRSQRHTKNQVIDEFQQVFKQLFGEELPSGLICNSCITNLHQIIGFKRQIHTLRLGNELQTCIKLEGEARKDDPDIHDAFSNIEPMSENSADSAVAQTRTRTKLSCILQKYGAKLATNDTGRVTKSPKIVCPLCDKILTAGAFNVHMKRHQGIHQLNFMCEICSKKFPSNSEFVIHKRSHTKEKILHLQEKEKKNHPNGGIDSLRIDPETDLYHCKACDGQFRTINAHDNHFCAKNTNDGPSQQLCLICNTKSKTRLEATKHIQDFHAEKIDDSRWKCLVCKTVVAGKIILHIESVHASLGSKCEYCNKELKNRRCLKNHIYVVHNNGSEVRKMKRKLSKMNKS